MNSLNDTGTVSLAGGVGGTASSTYNPFPGGPGGSGTFDTASAFIPEPSSLTMLFLLGTIGMAVAWRRCSKAA